MKPDKDPALFLAIRAVENGETAAQREIEDQGLRQAMIDNIAQELRHFIPAQQQPGAVREALEAAREYVAGMLKPISVGSFSGVVSSYNPAHGVIAKIDAALSSSVSPQQPIGAELFRASVAADPVTPQESAEAQLANWYRMDSGASQPRGETDATKAAQPVGLPESLSQEAPAPQDSAAVRKLVDQQADDEGCWFKPQTITEDYLQRRLRELHAAIEGTDFYGRSQEVTTQESWYCDPCAVEVYQLRCPHCGKTKREKR